MLTDVVGQEAKTCGNSDVYNVMADVVLSCNAPTEGRTLRYHYYSISLLKAHSRRRYTTGLETTKEPPIPR